MLYLFLKKRASERQRTTSTQIRKSTNQWTKKDLYIKIIER